MDFVAEKKRARHNWLAVILVQDGRAEFLTLRVISKRTQLLRPENAKVLC